MLNQMSVIAFTDGRAMGMRQVQLVAARCCSDLFKTQSMN